MCLLPGQIILFNANKRSTFLIESYPRTETITNVVHVIENIRKCYKKNIRKCYGYQLCNAHNTFNIRWAVS